MNMGILIGTGAFMLVIAYIWGISYLAVNAVKIDDEVLNRETIKMHKRFGTRIRIRFAWLPVRRFTKDYGPYYKYDGYYWLREVLELEVGVVPTWTAYSSYNDLAN